MLCAQLEALNRKHVQQRKRTVDEVTRMAGKNFVSGHMDPKIQRTIEDMTPMMHKPEQQSRDPTDIESYLEECRQQLVMNTIRKAQASAKSYSDDAFESAMQRDWHMAQKRLLEDLSGDPSPWDNSGSALQEQQIIGVAGATGGALLPLSDEHGVASEAELRKINRYVDAVITGRTDTHLRERVTDLADACIDGAVARKESEVRMYEDLWQCVKCMAEATVNQSQRPQSADDGDNRTLQALIHGCLSFLEREYKEHLEQECSRHATRGSDPAFEHLAAQFLETQPKGPDDTLTVEAGSAGSGRRCAFWAFAYLCVRCASAGGVRALRKTLVNVNNQRTLEEVIMSGCLCLSKTGDFMDSQWLADKVCAAHVCTGGHCQRQDARDVRAIRRPGRGLRAASVRAARQYGAERGRCRNQHQGDGGLVQGVDSLRDDQARSHAPALLPADIQPLWLQGGGLHVA